jgi:hypothetical protein
VTAAVDEARASGAGVFRAAIELPVDAPAELRRRSGQSGRMRVLKVRYEGFDPLERLLPIAVAGDDLQPFSLDEGDVLLRGELSDDATPTSPAATSAALDDAADELLFELQGQVDEAEQRRFEAAIQQAERFVQDRLLVLGRRRAELGERLASAEARRDSVVGADRRTDLDALVESLGGELERLDERIAALERREDATFTRHREKAHQRRYAEPLGERLFELEFVIR